jgi:cell division protein FtsW (lipid II flippase)
MTTPSAMSSNTRRWQAFSVFAVASFIAIACGAATLKATGLPFSSWIRNPIAWLVGLVGALGLMRVRNLLSVSRVILAFALVAVAGTFLAPAQSGVHRWIDAGPLHVNIAALVLPSAVVALSFFGIWSRLGLAFVTAIAALLVLQPDASQATSVLVGVMALLAGSPAPRAGRITAVLAAIFIAAISWSRPDPLQPVAEVEGILRLATSVSPLLAVAAAVALTATFLAPLVIRTSAGAAHRTAAIALSGYFISTGICTDYGAFPVPLVGLGMSFPVGYWLGIALLCANGSSRKTHITESGK